MGFALPSCWPLRNSFPKNVRPRRVGTSESIDSFTASRCLKASLRSDNTQVGYGYGEERRGKEWQAFETVVHIDGDDDDRYADFDEVDANVVDIDFEEDDVAGQKRKKERRKTQELLSAIHREPKSNIVTDPASLPPIEKDETTPWVKTAVRAADDRKAIDPIAIRVTSVTFITSFLVVCSGKSQPQIRAISNLVQENMYKEHGLSPRRSAGTPSSGWILLDCRYMPFFCRIFL